MTNKCTACNGEGTLPLAYKCGQCGGTGALEDQLRNKIHRAVFGPPETDFTTISIDQIKIWSTVVWDNSKTQTFFAPFVSGTGATTALQPDSVLTSSVTISCDTASAETPVIALKKK